MRETEHRRNCSMEASMLTLLVGCLEGIRTEKDLSKGLTLSLCSFEKE